VAEAVNLKVVLSILETFVVWFVVGFSQLVCIAIITQVSPSTPTARPHH